MSEVTARAKVPQDVLSKWSTPDWTVISKLLAHNAKGRTNVLIGEKSKPDAVFWVAELPILRDRLKKGLITGIDQWKVNAKGALVGPMALTDRRHS